MPNIIDDAIRYDELWREWDCLAEAGDDNNPRVSEISDATHDLALSVLISKPQTPEALAAKLRIVQREQEYFDVGEIIEAILEDDAEHLTEQEDAQ